MTVVSLYFGAVIATMKRDATIFLSYRLRFITQILGVLLSLITFYYIAKLVRPGAVGGRDDYYPFVVIGIVIMSVLTAALTTSQIVRMELMQGNFERTLISPLGAVGGVISLAAFPILYAMAFTTVTLMLSVLLFGVPLHLAGVPLALVVGALGTLGFACIGFLFVGTLLAFKSPVGPAWVVAGLALLGGAYFPTRLFPGWLRWVSEVQPFTPTVDLLRHLLIGTPALQPVWLGLLKLGGFAALLLPLSIGVVVLGVNHSRRRGTLMEY
jgi:ABC-type multidrug transport system permease subunit